MNVRLILAVMMSALLLVPAARAEEETFEIRSFVLEHVSVREANAILRSLLDIRKAAVDEQRNALLLGDRPSALARAADLLRDIDQPSPRWQARLVAVTPKGEVAVRTMPLTGPARWSSGGVPPQLDDRIALSLTPRALQDRIVVSFQLEVAAAGTMGGQSFRRIIEEEHSLADGDSFDALVVTPADAQAAVARLVGTEHPVSALRILIEREGPPKARRPR